MKKHPEKYIRANTQKQHLEFIKKLSCARCHGNNSHPFLFDEKPELSLPLCDSCEHFPMFSNESKARTLARNLWILSGDNYSAMLAVLNAKDIFV